MPKGQQRQSGILEGALLALVRVDGRRALCIWLNEGWKMLESGSFSHGLGES